MANYSQIDLLTRRRGLMSSQIGGGDDRYIDCNWIATPPQGGAYIDTGVFPNANYSVEITAMMFRWSPWAPLFGTRVSDTDTVFTIRTTSASGQLRFSRSGGDGASPTNHNDTTVGIDSQLTAWHRYGIYGKEAKIDGTTVHTFANASNTNLFPNSIWVGAQNGGGGTSGGYGFVYIAAFKIWNDNGVLIRDMVPKYDTVSLKYGLYDNVSRNFYQNLGGQDFIGGLHTAVLPEGYTELDYVQFNGGQMLEFSETINATDCFELEYQYNALTAQTRALASQGNTFELYLNANKQHAYNYGSTGVWVSTSVFASVGRNYAKMDGYTKVFDYAFSGGSGGSVDLSTYTEGGSNLWWIGARDTGWIYLTGRYFSIKKYEGNVLARHLVPCLYNGDYGFYDLVKQTFHTTTGLTGGNIIYS